MNFLPLTINSMTPEQVSFLEQFDAYMRDARNNTICVETKESEALSAWISDFFLRSDDLRSAFVLFRIARTATGLVVALKH